jgi:hypothetical protein
MADVRATAVPDLPRIQKIFVRQVHFLYVVSGGIELQPIQKIPENPRVPT